MQTYLNFFQLGSIPSTVVHGYYNYYLVALSYIIAILISYVALDLIGRLRDEPNKQIKRYWLVGSACVMGTGIWTMHFIGMLAYVMPMPMFYDSLWTVLSLLISIFGCGIACYVLRNTMVPTANLIIAGIIMGLSIVTMHYIGMEAMESENMPKIFYLPSLFILSILIAIISSAAAIAFAVKSNQGPVYQQLQLKILSAIIMGIAISGMHYTGMAAAIFLPMQMQTRIDINSIIPSESLAAIIALIIILISFLSLIISTLRQLVLNQYQRELTLNYLRKVEESRNLLEEQVQKRTAEINNKNIELSTTLHQLQIAQDTLVQTEKLATIGQLAAGLAHEINNPLSYVMSNLTIITKNCKSFKILFALSRDLANKVKLTFPENTQQDAEAIINFSNENRIDYIMSDLENITSETNEGLVRIKNIVSNLSQFSGLNNECMEHVDIHACIQSAIEMSWNQLKYKCEIIKKYGEIPKIFCSFKQLELVLINLLLNAAQSTADKGKITVATETIQENILISIEDTGTGIAKENIPKLFTPFFTTKSIGEGTGTGLAICYGIIKSFHGDITVESQVGKGSKFTIKLPIGTKA